MKFVINGKEYEGANLERITGRHALDCAKYAKVGVAQVAERLDEMNRLSLDADGNVIVLPEGEPTDQEAASRAVFASEPHLRAMLVMVWMSWRLNGEDKNRPWSDVEDYPILTLRVINDVEEPEDDQEGEDPTPPSATAPVAGGEARPSRRSSKGSTTSKRTSRRGS